MVLKTQQPYHRSPSIPVKKMINISSLVQFHTLPGAGRCFRLSVMQISEEQAHHARPGHDGRLPEP
jgi:hypothetical protein